MTFGKIIILVALSGLLVGTSHACYIATHSAPPVLPENYPTREVIDTKKFDRLLLNDSLTLVVAGAYYSAFPKEMGLCIYGEYTNGGSIVVTGLRADSVFTEENQVRIFCTELEEDAPIIGNVHSHPGAGNPAFPCTPSQQDYFALLTGNLGVQVIYCANGSGVTVFRDGRWWVFAWR